MSIDVFISYHTSTCQDIETAIVNKLEGKGIRCWYAARDIVHDDYAIQIHEAIQSCKVFLVLLNKESSESEDVLNEIHIAIQRVREHADISIMTFRLADRDEINPEAKYFLGRKHWIDGVEPELKERIDELIPQVLSTLGEKEGAFHNIENEEKQTPAISSPVINSNINIIGRDDFLIELHEMLKHEAKIFVQGLGGIGKSEAVRQYIRKYGNEYDTVIFLQYHGDLLRTINDDGANGISIFDIKQNQGETDEEYFFRKLLKLKGLLSERALFVLDNYDTVEDSYLEYLIQIGCRMIITTRMDHSDKGLPVLHMDYLPVFDQINLMKRYCKQIRTSEDEKVASAIVQMVDGHTLTIILLAELMQRKHIGPTKMVTMLDHYGLYSVLNEKIHGGGSTALERIRRVFNMFSLSSDEKHILTNMSLMPISGIDFSLFVELCELEDGSVVDDLIRSSWLLYYDQLTKKIESVEKLMVCD